MTSTAVTPITLEEFSQLANLEESPAWELLDQSIVQKPMPTIDHSRLQKRLVAAIDQANGPYEAFPELRCVLTQQSIVPDVVVISPTQIPKQNAPVSGAPDWLIEILSPDQSTTKLIAKIQTCLQEGTQLGWLIDSQEKIVMVFQPHQPLQLMTAEESLPVLPNLDLQLTPTLIFAWIAS